MYFTGCSIDNLSLMAIILAIGFIVDDSIVVLENTTRHIENGVEPYYAFVKSVKEITSSIISMSLSIVIVFIPIVFMPGIIGRTFKEFGLTVIIMVVCSGILSLTLTPMLGANMLRPIKGLQKSLVQNVRDKYLNWILQKYGYSLKYFLHRPYIALAIWIICIIGTFYLFTSIPKTFISSGDSGIIVGKIIAPPGTSMSQMNNFQTKIFNKINLNKNVAILSVNNFNNGIIQTDGHFAAILKPVNKRAPIDQVINEFRKELANLSNPIGHVYFFQIPVLMISTGGATNPGGSTYSYRITGPERDIVDKSTLKLEKLMKENSNFVAVRTNIQDDTPQIKVKILRNKAYLLGLSVEQIERAVNLAFSRGKVSDYIVGTEKYNVYLQMENKFSDSISTMSQIYISSSTTNKLIPLSSVIRLKKTVGPESVVHYNQLNTATLSFSLNQGVPLSKATAVVEALARNAFPANVGGSFQGHAEQFLILDIIYSELLSLFQEQHIFKKLSVALTAF